MNLDKHFEAFSDIIEETADKTDEESLEAWNRYLDEQNLTPEEREELSMALFSIATPG